MSLLSSVSNDSLSRLATHGTSRGGIATTLVRRAATQELGERISDFGNFSKLSDKQLRAQWKALTGKTDIVSRTTVMAIIVELNSRAHTAARRTLPSSAPLGHIAEKAASALMESVLTYTNVPALWAA